MPKQHSLSNKQTRRPSPATPKREGRRTKPPPQHKLRRRPSPWNVGTPLEPANRKPRRTTTGHRLRQTGSKTRGNNFHKVIRCHHGWEEQAVLTNQEVLICRARLTAHAIAEKQKAPPHTYLADRNTEARETRPSNRTLVAAADFKEE